MNDDAAAAAAAAAAMLMDISLLRLPGPGWARRFSIFTLQRWGFRECHFLPESTLTYRIYREMMAISET